MPSSRCLAILTLCSVTSRLNPEEGQMNGWVIGLSAVTRSDRSNFRSLRRMPGFPRSGTRISRTGVSPDAGFSFQLPSYIRMMRCCVTSLQTCDATMSPTVHNSAIEQWHKMCRIRNIQAQIANQEAVVCVAAAPNERIDRFTFL
jgi:hypothetical protein